MILKDIGTTKLEGRVNFFTTLKITLLSTATLTGLLGLISASVVALIFV